ncbi:tryptophan dimethylallyltransferase-domain-containing protein [Aspergillus recurvatus]
MAPISNENHLETIPTPLPSKGKPGPKPTTHTTTTQPFAVLTSYLHFANEAQNQWWLDSGSLFARLLQASQYTTDQQYQHLLFFYRNLLPSFGTYPPTWFSIVSRQGLAIEYSLNFQESGNPVIRSAFEPLSHASGKDAADPLNKRPAEELLARLEKQGLGGFDTALFNHVRKTIFVSDEQTLSLEHSDTYGIKTHTALGFDMKGDRTVIKCYMHPRWRSLATGVPVATLIRESFERIKEQIDCAGAFRLVDEYMEVSGSWDLRTFIAWDCVPLERTRLEIYGINNEVSLAKIEELWTMGGRLNDETAHEGLTLLRRLWTLLEINKDDRLFSKGDEEKLEYGPTVEGLLPLFWNYEIWAGSDKVAPKIDIPVFGENDLKVASAISRFFESLGPAWLEKADGYVDLLRGVYPHLDISQTTRLQALISFAYSQEKGVYMSVYYHSTSSYPFPGRTE